MIAMVFFSEGSLGPFLNNLNDLIVRRFAISYADTGKLLIIPFGALSIFSVIVGKVFTQNSKIRRKSFLFSTSLYFVMMAALYFVPNQESPSTFYYFFVALFLLTMSFAFSIFYSGMCTSISYVVK